MGLVIKAKDNISRLPHFLVFVKVKLFLSNKASVELLIKLLSLLKIIKLEHWLNFFLS